MCVEEDPLQELVDFETTGLEADQVTEVLLQFTGLRVFGGCELRECWIVLVRITAE